MDLSKLTSERPMSIDLSRLTPAPWIVEDCRDPQTMNSFRDPKTGIVSKDAQILSIADCYKPEGAEGPNSANRWPMPVVCIQWDQHTVSPEPTDLEFIALARNAFDVMMRRGWSVQKDYNGGWFSVETVCDGKAIKADDPFTAIVEADKWYRANVETKGGEQ